MYFSKKVLVITVLLLFVGCAFVGAVGRSAAIQSVSVSAVQPMNRLSNNVTPYSNLGTSKYSTRRSMRASGYGASSSYKSATSSYQSGYSVAKSVHTTTKGLQSYMLGGGSAGGSQSYGGSGSNHVSSGGYSSGLPSYNMPSYNSYTSTNDKNAQLFSSQQFGNTVGHNRSDAASIVLGRGIKRVPVLGEDGKWYDDETGEECDPPSTAVGYKDPVTGKIWNGSEWIDNATEIFPVGSTPWLLVVIMLGTYIFVKRIRKKA